MKPDMNLDPWQGKPIRDIICERGCAVALFKDGTLDMIGRDPGIRTDLRVCRDIVAVAAGDTCVAYLNDDGVVGITGASEWAYPAGEWTDIVDITGGVYFLAGLKRDGTVVMVSQWGYGDYGGAARAAAWTDMVSLHADRYSMVGQDRKDLDHGWHR